MYIEHKILENGWIKLAEKIDGKLHRSMIAPNQPVEKYNDIIETDEDFATYRTQANIDAYIANSVRPQPSIEQWRSTASLTRRKFMLGIKFYAWGEGTLEDAIWALRAGLPEPQRTVIGVSLDSSNFFERNDPELIQMATAIGMNADQIDGFFHFAQNEDWRNG